MTDSSQPPAEQQTGMPLYPVMCAAIGFLVSDLVGKAIRSTLDVWAAVVIQVAVGCATFVIALLAWRLLFR